MTSSSDALCGVYQVWLSDTHFYLGRSSDIHRRMRVHLRRLIRGVHENSYMQRVYNKHGHFTYDILFPCAVADAPRTEAMYLSTWMKVDGCMNLNPSSKSGPGMTGRKHTEETKARIREARSRQVFSEETRRKLSASSKGNKNGGGWHGPHSVETRLRISESKKGKPLSEGHRAALSTVKRGRSLSENHRAALSIAQKERWARTRAASPASPASLGDSE